MYIGSPPPPPPTTRPIKYLFHRPCEDIGCDETNMSAWIPWCVYRDHGWRQNYGAKIMAPNHHDIVEQTKTRQRIFSDRWRCNENNIHLLLHNKKGWGSKIHDLFSDVKSVCVK